MVTTQISPTSIKLLPWLQHRYHLQILNCYHGYNTDITYNNLIRLFPWLQYRYHLQVLNCYHGYNTDLTYKYLTTRLLPQYLLANLWLTRLSSKFDVLCMYSNLSCCFNFHTDVSVGVGPVPNLNLHLLVRFYVNCEVVKTCGKYIYANWMYLLTSRILSEFTCKIASPGLGKPS